VHSGWSQHLWYSQDLTHCADFVFEELPQGLYQLKLQILRQSTHIVMALDGMAVLLSGSWGRTGLYHIRVERALYQECWLDTLLGLQFVPAQMGPDLSTQHLTALLTAVSMR
jgi:hypothetical protein